MKLGERREKWGAMDRLVVSFWDCFTVTLGGLMLLYFMEGGGLVVLPGEILVEYVQNGDILDQLGQKLCLQDSSFSWLLGTGMVLKL